MALNITTPVGRLVSGSLYEPNTTDYEGRPLVGKDKVTPRVDYNFGVAIPKTPGVGHWGSEAWGAPIWALGNAAFTNGECSRPDFAWKITDGDSAIPNKKGRKPCDREGYPGHWVVFFSGGYAPGIWNADGTQKLLEKDAIKPGYYVQVFGNVSDNKPSQSPGIYINHTYVALTAYGPEISTGPDVAAAGFGAGVQLPPGASATPPAGNFTPAPPAPPGAPSSIPPLPPVVVAPSSIPPLPPVVVAPNASILNVPTPPPAPPVGPQMTAKANGATREQLIAAGWTEALLIYEGLMTV